MPTSPPTSDRPPRKGRGSRLYAIAFAAIIGGPVIALGAPDGIRIPPVHDHGEGNPADPALFSHWAHVAFTCVECHPSIFPQRKMGFTHDEMAAGQYCGSCHNGRTAFGPKDRGIGCETCHVVKNKREIDENDLWK